MMGQVLSANVDKVSLKQGDVNRYEKDALILNNIEVKSTVVSSEKNSH